MRGDVAMRVSCVQDGGDIDSVHTFNSLHSMDCPLQTCGRIDCGVAGSAWHGVPGKVYAKSGQNGETHCHASIQ